MSDAFVKSTLALVLALSFASSSALANGRGRSRAAITDKIMQDAKARLRIEIEKPEFVKTIETFFEAGQTNTLRAKAEQMIESGIETDPVKAVALTAQIFAAMEYNRPVAEKAMKAAGDLRKTGDKDKVGLAREAFKFTILAATSNVRMSSVSAEKNTPADVIIATISAIELAPGFEGSGIKPLSQMLAKINSAYEAQGKSKSLEKAVDSVIEKEKRQEYVENCRK